MGYKMNDPVAIALDNITVYERDIINMAKSLCDTLRYEFIFCRPCQELEDVIVETIRNLSYTGILIPKEVRYFESRDQISFI